MQTNHLRASHILIVALFLALFLFSYANQFLYKYEVPAGGDAIGHLRIVKNILGGDYLQIFRYHTIWHVTVGIGSLLFHIPSITVMAWLSPLLLFTMGVSLFYFNTRSFGLIAGVSSLILIG